MQDRDLITTGSLQGQFQRVCHITRLHRGAQLPGDNVPREVVENGGKIEPPPSHDLDVGEVGLSHLIDGCGFVTELVRSLDDNKGRAANEVPYLEQPIDCYFRHEAATCVNKPDRQFPRLQIAIIQSHLDDLVADIIGNAVPNPLRLWRTHLCLIGLG